MQIINIVHHITLFNNHLTNTVITEMALQSYLLYCFGL